MIFWVNLWTVYYNQEQHKGLRQPCKTTTNTYINWTKENYSWFGNLWHQETDQVYPTDHWDLMVQYMFKSSHSA